MPGTNATLEAVNNTLPLLAPLIEKLQAIFDVLKWLVGGLFGLYLIFMFLKWYEFRKIRLLMAEMLAKVSSLDKRVQKIENQSTKKTGKKKTK